MSLKVVFVFLLFCGVSLAVRRVINTDYGDLAGFNRSAWSGREYWAFRGIRYAQPPVGPLRFKAPLPPKRWNGVRPAIADPPACIQLTTFGVKNMSEDCLFLNVYTPKIETSQPVIVFFHPGLFLSGTARSDHLGPEYLMDHDIVLVVVNSRLGPFGYLSTGDKSARGNYGLKDQVAALKWVKENINRFGGNPDLVTIAGSSTGATSVLLHMVSPMSKGLFRKAIAMSGPAFGDWLIRTDLTRLTKRIAELNNCPTTFNDNMVNCLRSVPAMKLINSTTRMRGYKMRAMTLFTPTVESSKIEDKHKFLPLHPSKALKTGQFTDMPIVLGITKDEYFGINSVNSKHDAVLDQLSSFNVIDHPDYILKQTYLANETMKNASYGTGKVLSDLILILPQIRTARYLIYKNIPVYFYMTTFHGNFSFVSNIRPDDVGHCDDLPYIFLPSKKVMPMWKKTDREAYAVETFTSIWANFARIGDPTPTNMKPKTWQKWVRGHPKYLVIGNKTVMKSGIPHGNRMIVLDGIINQP